MFPWCSARTTPTATGRASPVPVSNPGRRSDRGDGAGLSGDGIADLAVFNGGSGTVVELPGVGRGDSSMTAIRARSSISAGAIVQPPTFGGTSDLGYGVTAGGDLVGSTCVSRSRVVRRLFGPAGGRRAGLAKGGVVVALADGGVNLLSRRQQSSVASVLAAQGGVPNLPSAIEVVTQAEWPIKCRGQQRGLRQHLRVRPSGRHVGGGGFSPSSSPAFFSCRTPTLAVATAGALSMTTSAIVTNASATTASASTSNSTSSTSVSSTATSSVGLSLGGFTSLGNSSAGGDGGTVLVPVEGSTQRTHSSGPA